MVLNRETEVALRMCVYLRHNRKRFVPTKELSQQLGIGLSFIRRMGWQLAKAELVKTREGVYGGYRLIGYPTILSVVQAVHEVRIDNLKNRSLTTPIGFLADRIERAVKAQLNRSLLYLCKKTEKRCGHCEKPLSKCKGHDYIGKYYDNKPSGGYTGD